MNGCSECQNAYDPISLDSFSAKEIQDKVGDSLFIYELPASRSKKSVCACYHTQNLFKWVFGTLDPNVTEPRNEKDPLVGGFIPAEVIKRLHEQYRRLVKGKDVMSGFEYEGVSFTQQELDNFMDCVNSQKYEEEKDRADACIEDEEELLDEDDEEEVMAFKKSIAIRNYLVNTVW